MSGNEAHSIDSSSSSPGAILKRCREYHDISLQEAEEATKIGANYLQALEEDQISQFGSPAYLKGFLRIYATYLGLNPEDMIRLFDKLYAPSSQSDLHTGTPAPNDSPRTKKRFPLQKLIMPSVLLVLLLISSMFISRSNTQNRPAPLPAATPIPSVPNPLQPGRSSARQSAAPLSQTPSSAPSSPESEQQYQPVTKAQQPAEQTKGFIVRMKVTQSGTLTVNIDGATSQAYDLVVGDAIEWKAARTITLELSNAGGVEAELNGKPLKSFGPAGKPAVVVLDIEGVRP